MPVLLHNLLQKKNTLILNKQNIGAALNRFWWNVLA